MSDNESSRQFAEMVARPDRAVDLAEAALLIAREEYPDLDIGHYLRRLDEMAQAVRGRLGEERAPTSIVSTINAYLFEDEGFHGNKDDYYDPKNSYLNDVLDRRTGIPITLSTVYMEIGRRVGLDVEGVGLPGHFIVKVPGATGDLLVDPFHGGTLLSEDDCQERLDRIYGGKMKMESGLLARCERKVIIARMLRNLKGIYTKNGDFQRALTAVGLLLHVNPHSREDLRDRGLLHASLDCYGFAARDLQAYLELVPGAPEAGEIFERIAELRQKAARLN